MSKTDAEKALDSLIDIQQSPLEIDAMQDAIMRLGARELRVLVSMFVSDLDFARALGVGAFSLLQRLETIETLKPQWFGTSRKRALLIEALVAPLDLETIVKNPGLAENYADALLVGLQEKSLPEPLIACMFEALASLEGDAEHPDVGSAFILQRGSLTEDYFGLYIDLIEKYQQKAQVLGSLAGKSEILLKLLDTVELQEETAKALVGCVLDNIWQSVRTFSDADASFVSEARNLFKRFLSKGQLEYAALMFHHKFSGNSIIVESSRGASLMSLFSSTVFGAGIPTAETNRQSLLAQVRLPFVHWLTEEAYPKPLISEVLQHANLNTVKSLLSALEKPSELQVQVLHLVCALKSQLNTEVFSDDKLAGYYRKFIDFCTEMLAPSFEQEKLIIYCEELNALLLEQRLLSSHIGSFLNDDPALVFNILKKMAAPALVENNLS